MVYTTSVTDRDREIGALAMEIRKRIDDGDREAIRKVIVDNNTHDIVKASRRCDGLLNAVGSGAIGIAADLIHNAGIDPNEPGPGVLTAGRSAAMQDHTEMLRMLLAAGFDPAQEARHLAPEKTAIVASAGREGRTLMDLLLDPDTLDRIDGASDDPLLSEPFVDLDRPHIKSRSDAVLRAALHEALGQNNPAAIEAVAELRSPAVLKESLDSRDRWQFLLDVRTSRPETAHAFLERFGPYFSEHELEKAVEAQVGVALLAQRHEEKTIHDQDAVLVDLLRQTTTGTHGSLQNAIEQAAKRNSTHHLRLLQSHGHDASQLRDGGKRALGLAIAGGHTETVTFLLEEAGLDPRGLGPYVRSHLDTDVAGALDGTAQDPLELARRLGSKADILEQLQRQWEASPGDETGPETESLSVSTGARPW